MIVTCHCTSQGCGQMGGRDIDHCTQKSHAHKDKARLVEMATNAADHAVEDQIEAIRVHLSSDVSSSPLTSVPAGKMWAYVPQETLPDTVDISAIYSPSRRELVRKLLSRLSKIKSSVKVLSQTVDSELLRSDTSEKNNLGLAGSGCPGQP
ncbi:hypothetical protein BYT27DRAFT_7247259 [Phlegmacium glaucopus]|nr:hypothetical protein BYT27DRAFT_7247259 [Phlegmacium glaucopus]